MTDISHEALNQAERILKKFGGASRLAGLFNSLNIRRNLHSIYKWTYPRERGGTNGLIPGSAMQDILQAARLDGILLTPEDLDPRPSPVEFASPQRIPKLEHQAFLEERAARRKVSQKRQLRAERLRISGSGRKLRSRKSPTISRTDPSASPPLSSQSPSLRALKKLSSPESLIPPYLKKLANKTHEEASTRRREFYQASKATKNKIDASANQLVRNNPTVGVPPNNATGPAAVEHAAPIPPPPLADQITKPEAQLKAETPKAQPRKTRTVSRYRAMLMQRGRIK